MPVRLCERINLELLIEISKQGIKFSYIRFLADSASGYILLLLLIIISYSQDYLILGFKVSEILNLGTFREISKEIQILVLFLLFLLSTPLGLAMNALSYFCLAWFQNFLSAKLIDCNFIIMHNTKNHTQSDEWKNFFGLSSKNWYEQSVVIENLIEMYYPDIMETLSHVEGLKTLCRNVALISSIFLFNWLVNSFTTCKVSFISFDFMQFLIVFPVNMALNVMLVFYSNSILFNKVFVLCIEKANFDEFNFIKNEIEPENKINEIRKLLIFRCNSKIKK